MMKLLNKVNLKNMVIIFISMIVISLVNLVFTNQNYTLSNIMDEFSYISMGAYFAGYDWSSLTSIWSAYYSYGYSILLAPFFLIFDNYQYVYYAAMILNWIFLLGSFLL